jgi:dTDP-4-amino-4,6-dideoxygalactose transaminase
MASLLQITGRHNLAVIEDAAQAIGSEYRDGRRAGSMGQLGCFSFFPSKNLGALGDAGMVVTNHADLADKVRILRVHGGQPKYYHKVIGGNFRLDTLQAAVLCVKFKYLDEWTRKRQANASHYAKLFNDSGLLGKGLIALPGAVHASAGVSHYHIYNQFVIRAANRDALRNYLRDQGIGTEVYYPVPLHLQECFRSLGYREGHFPEAERAARETLALPIYPEISSGQQQRVVEVLAEFYAKVNA